MQCCPSSSSSSWGSPGSPPLLPPLPPLSSSSLRSGVQVSKGREVFARLDVSVRVAVGVGVRVRVFVGVLVAVTVLATVRELVTVFVSVGLGSRHSPISPQKFSNRSMKNIKISHTHYFLPVGVFYLIYSIIFVFDKNSLLSGVFVPPPLYLLVYNIRLLVKPNIID